MAFSRGELDSMLALAENGLRRIAEFQAAALAEPPAAR
jgi:ribonuclease PH